MTNKEKYFLVKSSGIRDEFEKFFGDNQGMPFPRQGAWIPPLLGLLGGAGVGAGVGAMTDQGALRGAGIGAATGLGAGAGYTGGSIAGQASQLLGPVSEAGQEAKLRGIVEIVNALSEGEEQLELPQMKHDGADLKKNFLRSSYGGGAVGAGLGGTGGYFAGKAMFGKDEEEEA